MNKIHRFFVLFAVIFLSITNLIAQNAKDVVYLKNGSIIKGSIIEMIPDQSIKIQTNDGSIFVYAMSEVEKISKETVQSTTPSDLFGGVNQSAPSMFSIFGGVAIPVGDFGDDENAEGGAAKTGFTAGAQFVTGGQVGLLINASYSRNPMKDIGNPFGYDATCEYGSWYSILILAGPKIGTANPNAVNFFFAPVIGVNIAGTPQITGKINDTYTGYYYSYPYSYYYTVPITGEGTISSASNTVFAYGAMAEIVFGNFIIGARYIACKPKFEIKGEVKFSGSNGSVTVNGSGSQEYKLEQNTSIIFVYAGFAF